MMFQELRITHVASEYLWPQSLRTEVVSLLIIAPTVARVLHTVLGLGILVPWAGLMTCLGFQASARMSQLDMDQNLSQ
jgi:hypothetical protein